MLTPSPDVPTASSALVVLDVRPGESMQEYAARVIAETDGVPVETVTIDYIRQILDVADANSAPACSSVEHNIDGDFETIDYVHDSASAAA